MLRPASIFAFGPIAEVNRFTVGSSDVGLGAQARWKRERNFYPSWPIAL